ncbi:ras GTPase-activating protein-binding protein 2-like [Corticium candelabrum]|uniref:ras GTPase-activating protein-binding protein 2-like n=1 Tax=Corticium candelabrum TaxID=121492 RepID=UPI002E265177|nr:ras GTPase-activating protein-binding protein 2-like [Corticium candelabrum]
MADHYPPAQRVGHEFVRHYYTLLHQDPLQLHRFYLENSSFFHAVENSDDEPVVGQTNIYQKIANLNFVECHAVIKQVDSQPTLSDGVVVQVTGEISNNGQAMRPFVQTFVLSPKGPKKYYVRNDIFRYQDEIYEVESAEGGAQVGGSIEGEVESFVVAEDDMRAFSATGVPNGQEDESVGKEEAAGEEINEPEMEEGMSPLAESAIITNEASELADVEQSEVVSKQSAVSSWANIAAPKASNQGAQRASTKSIAQSGLAPPAPVAQSAPIVQVQRERPPPLHAEQTSAPASAHVERQYLPRPQKLVYNDNQQVFVGNIPQNVDEDEFRDIFKRYGNILDIRITPKHFGFVTFEDPQSALDVLHEQKELKLHGQRLNIEEKKSNLGTRGGRGRDNTGVSGTPGRGGRMDKDRDRFGGGRERYSGRGGGRVPPHNSQKY